MSQSCCLHDEGEESWPVKLHLGCGGIYLRDYTNIDIAGRVGVPESISTISDYYAGLDGDANHLPTCRETVCDLIADITHLSYPPSSVDKIVAIQVLEHLAPAEAIVVLEEWETILQPDGVLVLSVPDMMGTIDLLETNPVFAIRHLIGRDRNSVNSHRAWYTADGLRGLLEHCGFAVEQLPNFHIYPAIVMRAYKLWCSC